jgi:hypothetical protein
MITISGENFGAFLGKQSCDSFFAIRMWLYFESNQSPFFHTSMEQMALRPVLKNTVLRRSSKFERSLGRSVLEIFLLHLAQTS